MNKLYIFVTFDIFGMGGGQAYVASTAAYLRAIGWNVNVLFSGYSPYSKSSKFIELNNYRNGCLYELSVPPSRLPKHAINNVINKIKRIIGDYEAFDSIILESHDDVTSQWGEIIAQAIGAKHVFILMNEIYRGANKFYADKIDFYTYKLHRKEIMGSLEVTQRLFGDYLTVQEKYINTFCIDEEPVQDVEDKHVNSIKKYDYNICYIGRTNKAYVPNVIKGIADFSRKHPDAQIQFILIGDANLVKDEIDTFCKDVENLYVNKMGEIVPIPRSLFSPQKVDIFIAGSGSARCVAYEGAKVIVAGTEERLALGVLGIDTQESVYWDGKSEKLPFDLALEKVLIEKAYDGMKVNYPKQGVEYCTKQNFEAIARSEQKQEYYDIEELIRGPKVNYLKFRLKVLILKYFPNFAVFVKKNLMRLTRLTCITHLLTFTSFMTLIYNSLNPIEPLLIL